MCKEWSARTQIQIWRWRWIKKNWPLLKNRESRPIPDQETGSKGISVDSGFQLCRPARWWRPSGCSDGGPRWPWRPLGDMVDRLRLGWSLSGGQRRIQQQLTGHCQQYTSCGLAGGWQRPSGILAGGMFRRCWSFQLRLNLSCDGM